MARTRPQPEADREEVLECVRHDCPSCHKQMWNKYDNYRTVRTLSGVVRLRLKIRCCYNCECERFGSTYRPEAEEKWALPQYEFGLDVIATREDVTLSTATKRPPNPSAIAATGAVHQSTERKPFALALRRIASTGIK